MKIVLATILIFSSMMSIAQVKNLQCSHSADYLDVSISFGIYPDDISTLNNEAQGEKWVIDWSTTECEDYTKVTFDKDDYLELLSGKSEFIYGELLHQEPGTELQMEVRCNVVDSVL